MLFGINQFSISRSYLAGETNFSQFKTGTGINILGSLSPQYGLMFMTYGVLNASENAWNQYNSQPNTLRQFYNNMMFPFDEWKQNMNGEF